MDRTLNLDCNSHIHRMHAAAGGQWSHGKHCPFSLSFMSMPICLHHRYIWIGPSGMSICAMSYAGCRGWPVVARKALPLLSAFHVNADMFAPQVYQDWAVRDVHLCHVLYSSLSTLVHGSSGTGSMEDKNSCNMFSLMRNTSTCNIIRVNLCHVLYSSSSTLVHGSSRTGLVGDKNSCDMFRLMRNSVCP